MRGTLLATAARNYMIRPSVYLPLRLAAAALLLSTGPVFAQNPDPAAAATAQSPDVPVVAPLPTQIDLNLINLPTTMSIARHHSYFRLTHRFAGDLRRGDFGDLAADLFTLDKGAVIGLEYRFGITSNIPKTESIAILIEKNPNTLAAVFDVPPGTDPTITTRVKMGQSSNIYAVVKADGKYYMAAKEVKVTLGGCGG